MAEKTRAEKRAEKRKRGVENRLNELELRAGQRAHTSPRGSTPETIGIKDVGGELKPEQKQTQKGGE